ncbi:transmembrane protein [Anaeramoeba flamelloides]|uniref:Transmembrane protein n=1 Tax=Anaeramoeba flamelloides TaxID=1746091 RepID=A0ABQ8X8M5_9EUKA|nr:transmembrane protein [Anaeramoeba flamelloides]
MENEIMKMKVDLWGKKGFNIFFFSFLAIIILGIGIGFTGPYHYETREIIDYFDNKTVDITLEIVGLNRLNQFLYVDIHFNNEMDIGITTDVQIAITLLGNNVDDNDLTKWTKISNSTHTRNVECKAQSNCTRHTIIYEPYLNYKNYYAKLRITNLSDKNCFGKSFSNFYFVHKRMTLYELFFRYIFVMLNIIAMFLLVRSVVGIPYRVFTIEQKWISVLIVLLLLWNNPIWSTIILSHSGFVRFLDALFTSSFFVGIWGFWLCIIDGLRYKKEERTFKKFYLPKIIVLSIIYLTFLILYIWVQVHEIDDPEYEVANDIPGFKVTRVFLWLFYVVYLLWIVYACVRAFHDVKNTNTNNAKRFYFFFTITLTVFIFSIFVVGGNFVSKLRNTAGEFLSTFTIFNVYILLLSIAYLPSSSTLDDIKDSSHLKLEEEDVDDDDNNLLGNDDSLEDSEEKDEENSSSNADQLEMQERSETPSNSDSDKKSD